MKIATLAITGIIGLWAQIQIHHTEVKFDEPAITEEYGNPGYSMCDMGCVWVESNTPPFPDTKLIRRTRFTCADKTRFLMTAEDDTKHCLALVGKP